MVAAPLGDAGLARPSRWPDPAVGRRSGRIRGMVAARRTVPSDSGGRVADGGDGRIRWPVAARLPDLGGGGVGGRNWGQRRCDRKESNFILFYLFSFLPIREFRSILLRLYIGRDPNSYPDTGIRIVLLSLYI